MYSDLFSDGYVDASHPGQKLIGQLFDVIMKLSCEINLVSLSLELKRIVYKQDYDSYDIRYIKLLQEIIIESLRQKWHTCNPCQ
jgi:hypothetical protein